MRHRLGLNGEETISINGLVNGLNNDFANGKELSVTAKREGFETTFNVLCRIDTPQESLYYQHGGILQYVIRQLLSK